MSCRKPSYLNRESIVKDAFTSKNFGHPRNSINIPCAFSGTILWFFWTLSKNYYWKNFRMNKSESDNGNQRKNEFKKAWFNRFWRHSPFFKIQFEVKRTIDSSHVKMDIQRSWFECYIFFLTRFGSFSPTFSTGGSIENQINGLLTWITQIEANSCESCINRTMFSKEF